MAITHKQIEVTETPRAVAKSFDVEQIVCIKCGAINHTDMKPKHCMSCGAKLERKIGKITDSS